MPKSFFVQVKGVARWLRRSLRASPMQSVMRQLKRWGYRLPDVDAVECFASTGKMHTVDYAGKIRSLTLWEINPQCERALRSSFPKSTIRITDSYKQVRSEPGFFDLVVIDNTPIQLGHVDSFDLFPSIFGLAKDRTAFIMTVTPELNQSLLKMYPGADHDISREARRRFYHVENPSRVSIPQMLDAYGEYARDFGFRIHHHCARRRNKKFLYLALDLIRDKNGAR